MCFEVLNNLFKRFFTPSKGTPIKSQKQAFFINKTIMKKILLKYEDKHSHSYLNIESLGKFLSEIEFMHPKIPNSSVKKISIQETTSQKN